MKHIDNQVFYTWQDIQETTLDLIRQINLSHWKPDYIVGITRGGLIPANLMSQWFEVPMYALDVSLRDNTEIGPESNWWMAEQAFGYVPEDERGSGFDGKPVYSDPSYARNILIVDDINDSGATINWIKEDWQKGCLPDDPTWSGVWGGNVRFATLLDNTASAADVEYASVEINKHETPDLWIVFPWEDWWISHE